jgi:hypothetical protein
MDYEESIPPGWESFAVSERHKYGLSCALGPTKLWRSNSIFNLCAFAFTDGIQHMYNTQESEDGCNKYILF